MFRFKNDRLFIFSARSVLRFSYTRPDRGQAIFEYVLVLSFAVFITVAMVNTLSEQLREGVENFAEAFETELMTGTCPRGQDNEDSCFTEHGQWREQ
jgi:hypothetical protein